MIILNVPRTINALAYSILEIHKVKTLGTVHVRIGRTCRPSPEPTAGRKRRPSEGNASRIVNREKQKAKDVVPGEEVSK